MKNNFKATGSFISHIPKIVKVKDRKKLKSFFSSKSLMIVKADYNTYCLAINRKLARKLEIDDYAQVVQFPEAQTLFIGKRVPLAKGHDYRIYDGETLIIDDSSLAKRIVDAYNLDFSNCEAIVCRNLSYQPFGDRYMAIACFDN